MVHKKREKFPSLFIKRRYQPRSQVISIDPKVKLKWRDANVVRSPCSTCFPCKKPHQVTSFWREFRLSSGRSFSNHMSFNKRERKKLFSLKNTSCIFSCSQLSFRSSTCRQVYTFISSLIFLVCFRKFHW